MKKAERKSSYSRKGKRPFAYSQALKAWHEAIKSGDETKIVAAADAHRKQFGY